MSCTRLTLVAADQHSAQPIQNHLLETLGQPAFFSSFESVGSYLTAKDHGILLLLVNKSSDLTLAIDLIQYVRLMQWPCKIILLETLVSVIPDLNRLDQHLTARIRWPDQSNRLVNLIKDGVGRNGKLIDFIPKNTLSEEIGLKLLNQTPSLVPLAEQLALAASHDVIVLLTGETGTGKSYLARLIHECSPHSQHRLLTIPCGALVPNLVESELFGHVKGSFIGADQDKIGKLEAAGDGTIFLDEIETLDLEQQAKLLHVIETGEYEPVGSNRTNQCTSRIIVASNCNLEEAVRNSRFRQDLYYQLNVISFFLRPLRERMLDIGPLVRTMVARFARRLGRELFVVSPEAMAALEDFTWPGNIRQLENVIHQAVLTSRGPELLWRHLPKLIQQNGRASYVRNGVRNESLAHNREDVECGTIRRVLLNYGYNRSRAARALGISRMTLYKKMKKYGLQYSLIDSSAQQPQAC